MGEDRLQIEHEGCIGLSSEEVETEKGTSGYAMTRQRRPSSVFGTVMDDRARGGSRRIWAALVAAVLPLIALAGPLHTSTAVAATSSEGTLNFLDQTPWLEGHGQYNFRVDLAGVPPTDHLQVAVYRQVRTRTNFDDDASGEVNDRAFYNQSIPVTALPADASGGFDIELPVNQAPPNGNPFPNGVQIGETGVFPVQFQLRDSDGLAQGTPITTFIVYALQTASGGGLTPLSAAVIIPVRTAPSVAANGRLSAPSAPESARLAQLAGVLNNDSSVKASILASPLTLDELAAGHSATDATALSSLTGATVGGPFEVLPSPYSPLSLGDLQSALPDQVGPQLEAGAQTLQSVFQQTPGSSTWVVDGALTPEDLGVLVGHHATQVIVPDADLTPYTSEITFAGVSSVTYQGTQIKVVSADPGLTSDFTRNEPPTLAANQLLADLAMIYSEAPNASSPRGVAVMPPPGWSASPDFISTLLKGLVGDPLVSPVTASGLFEAAGTPQGSRSLSESGTPTGGYSFGAVTNINNAVAAVKDLGSVLGNNAQVAALHQQVLLAESETLTDDVRQSILNAVGKATDVVHHAVSLPPQSSITLTSTQGQVPITILTLGNLHPRVQLMLQSPHLIFSPFAPRGGTCQVFSESKEICTLSLLTQNTTLNVPVETRSSGVFPLEVWLFTPGGGYQLAYDKDTIRSTAVSGAAVIIIVVGLLALVLWWGRDLRRGRRPKGMVPAPSPEPDRATDPGIDEFFDHPPPDLENRAMSPSGPDPGPRETIETYGRDRETRT
jgi:hypothetical protein